MKISRFLLVFLTLILVGSMVLINCKSKTVGHNQLTQDEIDEGWVLLFDGETTVITLNLFRIRAGSWRTAPCTACIPAGEKQDGEAMFYTTRSS